MRATFQIRNWLSPCRAASHRNFTLERLKDLPAANPTCDPSARQQDGPISEGGEISMLVEPSRRKISLDPGVWEARSPPSF